MHPYAPLAESRATAALRSPHVTPILDVSEDEGLLFIVMASVRGDMLSHRTARGRLRPSDAVRIAAEMTAALDEVHASGLVHRNIMSANIMIDVRGVTKVLDFGLAKHVPAALLTASQPSAPVTADGLVRSTLTYMSPEQARGR